MGLGANTYLVQGANARMRMPAGGNSTGKIKMDVKRGLAPVVGTLWRPTEHISAALTYYAKQDNRSDFRFENTIGVLSPAILNLTAQSSLYFDPETYGGGVSYHDDKDTYAFSTLYERWSAFSGSEMRLNFESFLNSFSQTLPNSTFHDIWRLQAGYEHRWDSWAWRGGYSYFPSPVPEPVGDLNFLDSDRHTLHLGIGKKWEKPFDFLDGNFRLDIAGFVQYLTAKNIVKTNPNNIGYPGYKVGGWVYGYGLTATSEL
jgi:long-subunit fatty acid transport protein